MQIITLTTDFGAQDWFVGTMKGVILGIAPRATIVDITHEIPAGDIRAGAFTLAAAYRFFPKVTLHLAVVDPGVGGARKAIAVRTADHFFVGPDNGVLSLALAKEKIKSVHRLENVDYLLPPVSHTFHGRDIFAPVAAHLCCGTPIRKLGPAQKNFIRLPWPQPHLRQGCIEGEVVFIDWFGNAITNIENTSLIPKTEVVPGRRPALRSASVSGFNARGEVFVGYRRLCHVKAFYQAVRTGQAVAVPGSSGYLEIAVNGGSAAKRLRLKVGNRISVRWFRPQQG